MRGGLSIRTSLNDLAREFSEENNLSYVEGKKLVKSMLKIMKSGIKKGELSLVGFGIFHQELRSERELKMPNSSKVVKVSERKLVKFRASKLLKSEVNS